ncbi:MAG: methyltransferase domain-containing protein [Pseudomonadota bacterium]|nr:methyltransferase domain-containing protein [Pseudomonadota bacterium]
MLRASVARRAWLRRRLDHERRGPQRPRKKRGGDRQLSQGARVRRRQQPRQDPLRARSDGLRADAGGFAGGVRSRPVRQVRARLRGASRRAAPLPRARFIVAQLQPLASKAGLDVLDLGCGTGLCGALLKPWARSLTGLDVSANMIEEARRKCVYDNPIAGEIGAWLTTQEACFDLIVAADVFIYIGDLSGVFGSARQASRARGLFAFSTEASVDGDTRLQESLRYAHSPAYLQSLAAETGWQLVCMTEHVLREENRQGIVGHVTVPRRA